MATKVYVITEGLYSGYRIHGVSLTNEGAEKAIEFAKRAGEYWAPDADVDIWEEDELLTYRRVKSWQVGLRLFDGLLVEPSSGLADNCERITFEKPFRSRVEQFKFYLDNHTIVRVRSTVSFEHAVKVAVEKRQKWLRSNAAK